MIFLKPEYLTMMLIPTVILFYFIVTNKSALESYFDEETLKKLRFDNGSLGKIARNILLFLALIMMIVSLARPVKEKGEVQIKSKSIDMMVALDISKSMMAGDIYPSRLAFAKKRFVEFVDSFKEANIGIVAFSSEGFLVSPMTQDSSTLKYLVNNISLDSMTLKGTNLLIPIEKGNAFLKDSKEKIIIIFTDGGDKTDFTKEIERAKEYGESIYIYAVGTPEGGPIKENGQAIKDKEGNMVITKLNESIKTLAFESGGAYIVGNHEDDSIALMVADIKKKFKMRDNKEKKVKEYKELFYYPLSLAILFLIFALHSFPTRKMAIMIVFIMISSPEDMQAKAFDFFDINKGDKAYHDEQYEEAEVKYKEVTKSNKSAESIYNLANAQYKQGKYKEALKSYDNITAMTDALKYKKSFNKGNSHFQLKEYEKAIKAYEEAKKIESDEDLEHNLALAKKKLEEKKKKEQEKKNKDKNKDDKKKDDKNKEDKKKEDKKKDKKQGDGDSDKDKKKEDKKEDKDKESKKEKPQEGEKEQKSQKKEEISKKEEKMWEQHLENNKPKTMPMKLKMEKVEREKDEKPW